jgi:hypothetical protein
VLVQQNVTPIVENRGVQLVLSGHEHGYERSWPLLGGQQVYSGPSTTYVISGGGGGAMETVGSLPQCALSIQAFHYLRVDMNDTQLSVTATGVDGKVVDQFSLSPPPVLPESSVVSVGDLTPAIASGSLASIFGQNLAIRPAVAKNFPLSNQLGGVTVTANGVAVPVLYASPSQLNVQIPYEVSGQVSLQVNTANGSSSTSLQVVPLAPSILAVAVQNALCTPANPAQQSGMVVIYATGLGAAVSPVVTGQGRAWREPGGCASAGLVGRHRAATCLCRARPRSGRRKPNQFCDSWQPAGRSLFPSHHRGICFQPAAEFERGCGAWRRAEWPVGSGRHEPHCRGPDLVQRSGAGFTGC